MDAGAATIYGMSASGIVIAAVGIAKKAGLPTKWAPAASLGIGIVVGLAAAYSMGEPILAGAAAGILLGASACGIYDLGKNVINEESKTDNKTTDIQTD